MLWVFRQKLKLPKIITYGKQQQADVRANFQQLATYKYTCWFLLSLKILLLKLS